MHVRQLVELGAVVATHGGVFARQSNTPLQPHLEDYWLASRSRHVRWTDAINAYSRPRNLQPNGKSWFVVRPVIEEILASELLARTWAAVGCSRDRYRGTNELSPIVRSVLVEHLEARNRALNVMVYGDGFTVEEGVTLNRLRRQVERWTDMLLGFLIKDNDVAEFAFNAKRVREFAADLRFEEQHVADSQTAQMALASLCAAFQAGLSLVCPSADMNQRIASSILACFQHELFNATGTLKSLWMIRMSCVTDETECLINDLVCVDDVPNRRVSLRR